MHHPKWSCFADCDQKKKILVIPLLRTERETECNIVVKGKYTAELLRDVIFLLFYIYVVYIADNSARS